MMMMTSGWVSGPVPVMRATGQGKRACMRRTGTDLEERLTACSLFWRDEMTVGRTKWRCSSLWPGSAAQENIHIQSEYQKYVYNQDTLVLRLERQYRCSRRRTVSAVCLATRVCLVNRRGPHVLPDCDRTTLTMIRPASEDRQTSTGRCRIVRASRGESDAGCCAVLPSSLACKWPATVGGWR